MRLILHVRNALYYSKKKHLVMHGNAKKPGFFEEGEGDFGLEISGEDIRKLATEIGLSDTLTSVQVANALI